MSWVALAPPLLATLALLALLGAPVSLALRLRGYASLVVGIAAAFAVLALSPILASILGIPWSPIPPIAVSFALALILLPLRRWVGTRWQRPSRPHRLWVPLGSAALGGAAIAVALVMSMKSADAISQTYDANFHLNAVRQILDLGGAAPYDLDLAAPGQSVFYPALWHGLVALVVQLSGASIPLATNAVLFVVCAVVWPIGAVALGRAVAGPNARATLASGIVAAAFPSFPLALAGYGVLYPNLLSTALIPFMLVAVLQLLNLGRARWSDPLPPGTRWLLLLGTLGAASLAHPNALHVSLLWCAFPVLAAVLRAVRRRPARPLAIAGALSGALLFIVAIAVAWYIGRTGDNPWEGSRGPIGAAIDALGSTPRLEGHAWPVTLLILIGAVLAWQRRRLRWALGSAAILALFFIVAYGFPESAWRTLLLNPWYNDSWRLASLISIGALPLAVLGATSLLSIGWIGVRRVLAATGTPPRRRRTLIVAAAAGAAFLLAATQGAGAYAAVQYVSTKYVAGEDSQLLSPDERALIERLSDHVPAGETLANNPWNGGALAYALADYPVLVPHTGGTYDPRITEMTSTLETGDSQACTIADELDVSYVLDFGTRYVFKNTPRAEPFEGITDVEDSPVLTEVDREGDAVLYEITGCP